MSRFFLGFIPIFGILLLAACANEGVRDSDGQPLLQRLPEGTVIAAPQRLDAIDVVAMEKAGHPPIQILESMRSTGSRIPMNASQEKHLRDLGASSALIEALKVADARVREADRLTAEADKAAQERRRREEWEAARDYYYDPYPSYGYPWGVYPYVGYGSGYHDGWYGGVGFGW